MSLSGRSAFNIVSHAGFMLALCTAASGAVPPAPRGPGVDAVLAGPTYSYVSTVTDSLSVGGAAPVVTSQTGNFTATVTENASFAGRTHLTDVTYVYAANSTQPIDYYYGRQRTSSGAEQIWYGSLTTQPDGATVQTISAGSIAAEFPEAVGLSWSPAATSTTVTTSTFAFSNPHLDFAQIESETDYADGGYVNFQGQEPPIPFYNVRTVWSNGSGRVVIHVGSGYNPIVYAYSAPRDVDGTMEMAFTPSGGNPLPAPPKQTAPILYPDWFPSGDLAPNPLQSSHVTIAGVVTTPAACGFRAGMTAFDRHGTVTVLDPVLMSESSTTYDEFDVAGLGNVCTIATDVTREHIVGATLEVDARTTVTILGNVATSPAMRWSHPRIDVVSPTTTNRRSIAF